MCSLCFVGSHPSTACRSGTFYMREEELMLKGTGDRNGETKAAVKPSSSQEAMRQESEVTAVCY